MPKRFLNIIWEFSQTLAFSLGIFVVIYTFLFMPTIVLGSSSYPTVIEGEKMIISKIAYQLDKPHRGDFIIMKSPTNPDVEFIKRIVGLPHEQVELRNGKVLINGTALLEPYLSPATYTGSESFLSENQILTIPSDHYFVLGDNREHSSDSRTFGPVSESNIVGKVVFRFWPLNRLGPIND